MLTVGVNDQINIEITKYGRAMAQRPCLDDLVDFKG